MYKIQFEPPVKCACVSDKQLLCFCFLCYILCAVKVINDICTQELCWEEQYKDPQNICKLRLIMTLITGHACEKNQNNVENEGWFMCASSSFDYEVGTAIFISVWIPTHRTFILPNVMANTHFKCPSDGLSLLSILFSSWHQIKKLFFIQAWKIYFLNLLIEYFLHLLPCSVIFATILFLIWCISVF